MFNYFKPTPKALLKVSLALRGFIGTVATATYFEGNKDAAFWFLVAGAAVDLIIQCIDPNSFKEKINSAPVLIFAICSLWLASSCGVMKPSTQSEKTDSTWTTYKPVDVKVTGSSVGSAFNVDSFFAVLKGKINIPSSSTINTDSLFTELSKAIKEQLAAMPPNVVTDPETKIQLKYWYDQFGKLNMECTSKDQTIQMLVAEINKLQKEKKTETIVTYVPVWYTWAFLGCAVFATVFAIVVFILKR